EDLSGAILLPDPGPNTSDNVLGRHTLDLVFEVLEADPASAREGGEQQQAVRAARDSGLVARKGRGHRDVGDEELSAIRGALERRVHRMRREAVSAAPADDQAWAHRLRLAISVAELDDDLVAA